MNMIFFYFSDVKGNLLLKITFLNLKLLEMYINIKGSMSKYNIFDILPTDNLFFYIKKKIITPTKLIVSSISFIIIYFF